jgi:hypothetical protein
MNLMALNIFPAALGYLCWWKLLIKGKRLSHFKIGGHCQLLLVFF